jgi:NTE family protein
VSETEGNRLGIVLTGGGARAAYQVGFLRCLAARHPELRFSIITGVSAGAINAAFLAAHGGTTPQAIAELAELWLALTPDRVFRVDSAALLRAVGRWGTRLVSGGSFLAPEVRGLVDTAPLRRYLRRTLATSEDGTIPGIEQNLERGLLRAVAVSAVDYATGRTMTFIQGREVALWQRPMRRTCEARLGVDHVMASSALPLLFPAVQVGTSWYGDGGIRLSAPLSPALHLGADRILAISTRYQLSSEEAAEPLISGYPPPIQVAGVLMNAIFLDLIDQDARRLGLINQILERLPREEWGALRRVRLVVLRPSRNLGRLASQFEPELPRAFRFLTRGLGTRETKSPDLLSMLMFQPDYLRLMIELGEEDARAREADIAALLDGATETKPSVAGAEDVGGH